MNRPTSTWYGTKAAAAIQYNNSCNLSQSLTIGTNIAAATNVEDIYLLCRSQFLGDLVLYRISSILEEKMSKKPPKWTMGDFSLLPLPQHDAGPSRPTLSRSPPPVCSAAPMSPSSPSLSPNETSRWNGRIERFGSSKYGDVQAALNLVKWSMVLLGKNLLWRLADLITTMCWRIIVTFPFHRFMVLFSKNWPYKQI